MERRRIGRHSVADIPRRVIGADCHSGMGGEESFLTENVNLKYSKIKWKYTQQKIGGGSGGNTAGGWDLAANKIA